MKRRILVLAIPMMLGVTNAPLLRAQAESKQKVDPNLRFEVASVRRVDIDANSRGVPVFFPTGGVGTSDPTHYAWHGTWLMNLIQEAFGVRAEDISGRAAWNKVNTERYDIVVNIPAGATKEQFNVMLGNLLRDRLHLSFHIETKVVPAYALRAGKNGPRFKESDPSRRSDAKPSAGGIDAQGFPIPPPSLKGMLSLPHDGQMFLVGQDVTMPEVARWLSHPGGGPIRPDDRPVVDETGLTGSYDFKIHFEYLGRAAAADAGVASDPAPTKFAAAEQQLGLKLEPSTTTMPHLIVDSIDREPTEN